MTIEGFTQELSWTSATPVPYVYQPNTAGAVQNHNGAMSGTNTIYSQILDVSTITRADNIGLEITWTGTPTGTIQIMCSVSGTTFYALTFNPALGQPAGSGGGYLVDITMQPFRYFMVQYTNTSGSGTLTTWISAKAL
jgi:hypothetical protein